MKVQKLIEILNKLPKEAVVVINKGEDDFEEKEYMEVEHCFYIKEDKTYYMDEGGYEKETHFAVEIYT